MEHAERRLSFGTVAEQYDRHRPGYPAEMIDDVLAYADAHPGDRALEVGAGTGRATLPFAQRGLEVTALEPDPGMAAVASKRAATAGLTVAIVTSDFEDAALAQGSFRLLFSGTAWHWVTPSLRNQLAARVLEPGGALAPFWNRPVWEGNPIKAAFDAAYTEVEAEFGVRPEGPMNPRGQPREFRSGRDWVRREFRGSSDFAAIETRRYGWSLTYSSADYVGLIGTHSDHLLLPEAARTRLLTLIGEAIDAARGSFELTYETLLCLARRTAARP